MKVLDEVLAYAGETQHGEAHVRRWQRAANGIKPDTFPGVDAMTAKEAEDMARRFMAARWNPVVAAIHNREMEDPAKAAAYKAEQDAYVEKVKEFQAARDAGDPDAQQGFDEWKRRQTLAGDLFPFNGTYVMDTRTGCYIAFDKVAKRRGELTAKNVRYRLDCDRPDGIRQISWLALNYEGCLFWLPHYDKERAEKTRMVPAEEIPDLIVAGWRVLSEEEYAANQRAKHSREDRFSAFRLYVQYDPQDNPLGVCPLQGDPGPGHNWRPNAELFARLRGHAAEEVAPVDAPTDIANAILAGDWAEVARLAAERAGN